MYIEPLFPVAECIVVAMMVLTVCVYKYIVHRRYVKQYPYKVQRYLRSTDRVVCNWNTEPVVHEPRGKNVLVAYSDGKPIYIKDRNL